MMDVSHVAYSALGILSTWDFSTYIQDLGCQTSCVYVSHAYAEHSGDFLMSQAAFTSLWAARCL